jgi:hypothetical protein
MILVFAMKPAPVELPFGFYLSSPVIFGTALGAGILFWRRTATGYRLTIAIQTLQILQISSTVFTYNITLGLQFLLVFGGSWFRLSPGFYIASWLGKFPAEAPTFVAINAFSVIAVAYLLLTRWLIFLSPKVQDDTGLV